MNRTIEKKEGQQERLERDERAEKNKQTGRRSLWLHHRGQRPFLGDQQKL